MLEPLIQRLGSSSAPLRSTAYTQARLIRLPGLDLSLPLTFQILSLSQAKGKAPYNLISPYLDRISSLLAKGVVKHPDIVAETMSLIGYTRKSFFAMTLRYTVPVLVMEKDRQALDSIAAIVAVPVGMLLFDHAGDVLSKIFLCNRVEGSLDFLITTLTEHAGGAVTVDGVLKSCAVPFIVSLVVELGDQDPKTVHNAVGALQRAHQEFSRDRSAAADLGSFLKPHMLGIISQLNERLHDMQGKKSVEEKQKIIRSIKELIARVGGSMSSFSPQVRCVFLPGG